MQRFLYAIENSNQYSISDLCTSSCMQMKYACTEVVECATPTVHKI